MHEERLTRVGPLADPILLALDRVRELRLDGIALRHLDRRPEDVREAQLPVLREHEHEASGRARSDRRERTVGRRIGHAPALEELGRRTGGRDAKGVDADDLLLARMIDEGLRLTAPAEGVVHGGGRAGHRAGGVDGVPALLEHHRPGGGTERLAGDGDPVLAVEHGLLGALAGGGGRDEDRESRRDEKKPGIRHGTTPPRDSLTAAPGRQPGGRSGALASRPETCYSSRFTHRTWAASSAGRARRSQCRGHGFDPRAVHHAGPRDCLVDRYRSSLDPLCEGLPSRRRRHGVPAARRPLLRIGLEGDA